MTNKEINRVSGRLFESLLLPNWAFRSQEDQEDYGVDGEIEITNEKDEASGFIFKVQLKGNEKSNYNKSGDLTFSIASVERFKYYIDKLPLPIIFIVCDIESNVCRWTSIQGNKEIEEALSNAIDEGQDTFTIKLPVESNFIKNKETATAIINSVDASFDIISLRRMKKIRLSSISDYARQIKITATDEAAFRRAAGIIANEEVCKLIEAKRYNDAEKRAAEILRNPQESPESRVGAAVNLIKAKEAISYNEKTSTGPTRGAEYKLEIAHSLIEIAKEKKCTKITRDFVFAFFRCARLHLTSIHTMALAVSEVEQRDGGDSFLELISKTERLKQSSKATNDFIKTFESLRRFIKCGHGNLFPCIWLDWIRGINPYLISLKTTGHIETANAILNLIKNTLPIAVNFAAENTHDSKNTLTLIGVSFTSASYLIGGDFDESIKHFDSVLSSSKGNEFKSFIIPELKRHARKISQSDKTTSTSVDDLREYYTERALSMGINLKDTENPTSNIINIGIRDVDPTRVLKNCVHIEIKLNGGGVPAQMLNLPTAGPKQICCRKFGHACSGLDLDSTYQTFLNLNSISTDIKISCNTCKDKQPHPDNWSFHTRRL